MNCRILARVKLAMLLLAISSRAQNNTEIVNGIRIWRGRYDNCDHSYRVFLPKGAIAQSHATDAPNHGFAISLSEPATTKPFQRDLPRIAEVYFEPDVQEVRSPRAYFDQYDKEA